MELTKKRLMLYKTLLWILAGVIYVCILCFIMTVLGRFLAKKKDKDEEEDDK